MSDGAYPRRERRGIAPVQRITTRVAVLEDHSERLSIEAVDTPEPDPNGAVITVDLKDDKREEMTDVETVGILVIDTV
ncbi:hypothetical protein BDK88_0994 [Natrinema hispanicum]|uniref:Uncharacterized protein n=1 Tax=Natrinema hispanicum TaxID=392421 RepID=A0A482YBI7_9EURY|nr:hypothetical protein [Natrinema hispanicum]RZV12104.1 hypothetical protein BDK88_0994 [Natrinema hispanicum]